MPKVQNVKSYANYVLVERTNQNDSILTRCSNAASDLCTYQMRAKTRNQTQFPVQLDFFLR